ARWLCGAPPRRAAGAGGGRAGAGRVRDRGARRRSSGGEAAQDLSNPRPPRPGTASARWAISQLCGRVAGAFHRPAPNHRSPKGRNSIVTLARIAHSIVLSWGWRRNLIAFTAGAATAPALPPLSVWPMPFLTFPVLVWLVDGAAGASKSAVGSAAVVGWWFGFGYFLAGL